jgi:hypothetical protein
MTYPAKNTNTGRRLMTIPEYIATYAEGWALGDSEKIMSVVSEDMVLDDPYVGKITRKALPKYIAGFKNAAEELRASAAEDKLMLMSEVVIKDDERPASIWAWFTIPGTFLAGSALIKVANHGIVEERIAYYTPWQK